MIAQLVERVAVARAAWQEVEQLVDCSLDPRTIEHAAIAGLGMRHLAERLQELLDVDVVAELERALYGTVDELERERYGDGDGASA